MSGRVNELSTSATERVYIDYAAAYWYILVQRCWVHLLVRPYIDAILKPIIPELCCACYQNAVGNISWIERNTLFTYTYHILLYFKRLYDNKRIIIEAKIYCRLTYYLLKTNIYSSNINNVTVHINHGQS